LFPEDEDMPGAGESDLIKKEFYTNNMPPRLALGLDAIFAIQIMRESQIVL
jgi:hypothetical protein